MTAPLSQKLPPAPKPQPVKSCDVLILGSGLAGSVTASILARNGVDVVLIDAASHPRFAIGESTTPQLVEWLHLLSERYHVPEIRHLASADRASKYISPMVGVKAHFGFLRHEAGKEPDPREATQFALPRLFSTNLHVFRQDSDSYMFAVACRYGATTRQNWRAASVEFDDDGVEVTGQNGELFRSKYLIDASGFRSPLAEKFCLRESPARFKHHSRSLFTHFIGVRPFDEVSGHPKSLRPPVDWHRGTMHHLIDRGWFWIIPFDTHRSSRNPLCSVGLTVDERTYPRPMHMTPEQEWQFHLDKYPAVKRQFEGAHRVREWVSTDRLQYSSSRSIGDRWCLMSHAAGFIDPLFSRGLSNTFEVVDALASRVLTAVQDGDFSAERFAYVEKLERGLLRYNDDLVNSAYIAFSDFELWNAVFRVWGAFITPGVMRLSRARLRYMKDGNQSHFQDLEEARNTGLWWPESDKFKNLLEATAETCEKYEVGELTAHEAATAVHALLRDCDAVNPVFGWKDPDHRFVWPNTATMARFLYWASVQGPAEMNHLGRDFLNGILKAGVKARKLH